MTLSVEPSQNAIDDDMRDLLERWARWLRSGGGFGGSVTGGYEERHDAAHEEYRDLVSELIDRHIAKLPELLKRVIISHWYIGKSIRQMAKDSRMPRGRVETIHATGIGWLGSSIHNLTRQPVTVENLERWTES